MASAAGRWTPEQELAIAAGGSHVLVAAAAGSGKTATLIERIRRRLTDPAEPLEVDRLLVVTFTEAAAAEMRERLATAVQAALADDPGNDRLQRQFTLLGRATISTLHSFCLRLVRQHFYRLGLDPALAVISEHEALLLRQEVLEQLFEGRFTEEPEGAFIALVERYGGDGGGDGLKQLVLTIHDYAQSLPWPERWLTEAAERFALPATMALEETPWWEPLHRHVQIQLGQAAARLAEAERLARQPGGPTAYAEALERERQQVERAAAGSGWAAMAAAVSGIVFGKLPPVRADAADEQRKKRVQKLRADAKGVVADLTELLQRPAAEWLDDLRNVAPYMGTLVDLVRQFDAAFRRAKDTQGAVDFQDLECFALQLLVDPTATPGELRPSDVARELRERFEAVLVDEYQDINGVQDAILTLVARDGSAGEPNRFMVGDVKQSIYRFRHADPSLFLTKYQSYPEAPEPGAEGRRIVLGANFRSRAGVIDAVNFLFRQLMTAGVGEMSYDQAAELRCRADYPPLPGAASVLDGPPVELHLLDRAGLQAESPGSDEPGEAADGEEGNGGAGGVGGEAAELAEISAVEREARLVARRIRTLVEGSEGEPPLPVWDAAAGEHRPLRYRDVVILLRAVTGRANLFLEALAQAGVPAYAQLSTGYFAATEVDVCLSLLQVLDNPRQDIPLAAVLRSPLVGLSSADLARVRLAAPALDFYAAVLSAARVTDSLGPVLARFLDALERWRTAARRRPLSQVIWQIYQETGFVHYTGGMPGGAQRQANLIALYDRARQFDQFSRQGLFRFLRFIERLKAGEADLGTAPALGESEDVVRVFSIHKSKGLEFPVVILADLGKSFGRQDQQGDLLLHRGLGFGPQFVDPELRVKYPTLAWHAARQAIRLEALAEELRILYVALTRARERLILVGSGRDLADACSRWSQAATVSGWPLPDALLATAGSYLDWIGSALIRHPAGAPLLALAGVEPGPDSSVAADPSRWELHLYDAEALAELLRLEPAAAPADPVDWAAVGELRPLGRPVQSEAVALLSGRFAWRYPQAAVVQRPAKLSVTELKGLFDPEVQEPWPGQGAPGEVGRLDRRPRFLQDEGKRLTPAEFGTLMHLVLQHVDLRRPLDEADVGAQVAALAERGLITEAQAAAVDTAAIAGFFASPLGARIRRTPERVRREVAFTLGMPAAAVYPDLDPAAAAGEVVVVQGMIDLLLEEEDGFLLVDYKTDRRDPEAAAAAYRLQVLTYQRAVAAILGKPVREAYLHFLLAGQSVRV